METINPMNVLKLLQDDYRGRFHPDGRNNEADLRLRECLKKIVDETLEKLSGPDIQPEDLQFNIWIDGLSFEFEKNIAEAKLTMGVREDIDDVDEGRDVAQPSSSETEPSSNELFQPTTSSKQSLKVVSSHYKKRAVEFWRSSTKKKRRSLKSKVTCVLTDIS